MDKIILIGGDLAAGKSEFSRIISDRFSVTAINKDAMKELLGGRIAAHDREENLVLSALCFDFAKYFLSQSRSPLVVESNFKPAEMRELTSLFQARHPSVLSLRLTGEDHALFLRYQARQAKRNPIHKSRDLSKFEDFAAAQQELRSVVYPGTVIDIDATTFDYQSDEAILNAIEAFLKK